MATESMSTVDKIRLDNHRLDEALRRRVGISLEVYKIVKNLTQLAGAAAGVYSMHLGADPMTTYTLMVVIISGPEFLEYVVTNGND